MLSGTLVSVPESTRRAKRRRGGTYMAEDRFDAIVVGAGLAGCVAAYQIAKAGLSVLVIERGNYAGSKNMTGGRIYTHSLEKVFPGFAAEAPLERKITREKISLMTSDSNFTVDFTSEELGVQGRTAYSVLPAVFDQWLAEKAEEAGAEMIYGIRVDDLIVRDGRVAGVIAGDDELEAEITILADGVNSLLAQKLGFMSEPPAHQMAVGVKELLQLSPGVIEDRFQCNPGEGVAWLFAGDSTHGHAGGGFLYTNHDTVSLGLVATLSDLVKASTPVYQMLEDFKAHPAVRPLVKGGTLVEYSGHLVPEGGYAMVPKLYGDGVLVTGDAGMLCVNLGYVVRGMDFAVSSGDLAAQTVIEARKANDSSEAMLKTYKDKLADSYVLKDLKTFSKFPQFMEGTTRIYNQYPEMLKKMMLELFVITGQPVTPIRKRMMPPIKEVGLTTIARDAWKGIGAL